MKLSWTPEQLRWKEELIRTVQSELDGDLLERDRQQRFDRDAWRTLARLGLPGLPIASAYRGRGADALTTMLALEGLGYACRDNGLSFALGAHLWGCALPLARFGSEAQKGNYLPRLCSGEWIGALAASERGAGSDVYGLQTAAVRRDQHYRLTGSKMFVTNAPVAQLFVVLATLDPAKGAMGLSAFVVDRNAPGLRIGAQLEKMGLRTAPMAELFLDDCVVPAADRLGAEGNGLAIFSTIMEWERAFILAPAIGTMEWLLEQCVRHVRQRRQFGQPIGRFQAVADRVVDMRIRLETARALLYKVGALKQDDALTLADAAMAKLHVSEAWVQQCQDAIHLHGGYGYLSELQLERELRDAIGSQFFSGTADMQRRIIAHEMDLE